MRTNFKDDIRRSCRSISGDSRKSILAEFIFSDALEMFRGHFPEAPILPGIAQIEMVTFVLETAWEGSLSVRSVKKTKFSRQITPNTPVCLKITIMDRDKSGRQDVTTVRAAVSVQGAAAGKLNLIFTGPEPPAPGDVTG